MSLPDDPPIDDGVPILEHDATLGAYLGESELAAARRYLRASTIALPRGRSSPGEIGHAGLLGALLLDGFLIREIGVAGRRFGVLAGPGALLRPWDDLDRPGEMPFTVRWRIVAPARIALLDERMIAAVARWPGLMYGLFRRASGQAHRLSLLAAALSLRHVDLRLLTVMWLYAERWGRRADDATLLPVRLTHGDLAELVASQRPPVSAHLAELAEQGRVERLPDRTWLLRGKPPSDVTDRRGRSSRPTDA